MICLNWKYFKYNWLKQFHLSLANNENLDIVYID